MLKYVWSLHKPEFIIGRYRNFEERNKYKKQIMLIHNLHLWKRIHYIYNWLNKGVRMCMATLFCLIMCHIFNLRNKLYYINKELEWFVYCHFIIKNRLKRILFQFKYFQIGIIFLINEYFQIIRWHHHLLWYCMESTI